MKTEKLNKRLGIIGGGQLGKMLLSECNKMSITTSVLDPSDKSPCKNLSDKFICGDFNDFDTVFNFGKNCDIITFEIEHINVDALEALEKEGKKVYPKSKTLKIIQDKNLQKSFFQKNNIPTSNFKFFPSLDKLKLSIDKNEITFPCIWKKTKFGYDGFGVKVLKSYDDVSKLPDSEMIIEELVPFEKELSVIVARNSDGEVKCFETVEMEFNKKSNQVEFVISPANISENQNQKAKDLAIKLAKSLDCVGVLAVEMFMVNDEVLVNEVAPRPHNSYHFSIEGSYTSQFEQFLRAILDLPLGSTKVLTNSVMVNLVGEKSSNGIAVYKNFDQIIGIEGVNPHIYGKFKTKPNRKMGHVTIINQDINKAKTIAKEIKETLIITTK